MLVVFLLMVIMFLTLMLISLLWLSIVWCLQGLGVRARGFCRQVFAQFVLLKPIFVLRFLFFLRVARILKTTC